MISGGVEDNLNRDDSEVFVSSESARSPRTSDNAVRFGYVLRIFGVILLFTVLGFMNSGSVLIFTLLWLLLYVSSIFMCMCAMSWRNRIDRLRQANLLRTQQAPEPLSPQVVSDKPPDYETLTHPPQTHHAPPPNYEEVVALDKVSQVESSQSNSVYIEVPLCGVSPAEH